MGQVHLSALCGFVFKAVFLLSRTTSVPLDCVHYHLQLNEVQDHEEEQQGQQCVLESAQCMHNQIIYNTHKRSEDSRVVCE